MSTLALHHGRNSVPFRPKQALLCFLGLLATLQVGYQLYLGVQETDVGPFETVLARTVAGHFETTAGPARFYGPFDGTYPAVLMHAPLYYRLVAILAWPAILLGCAPLTASLITGRCLSVAGTALLVWSAASLSSVDRRTRSVGFIVASLLLASPLLGNLAIMLRPDALGVGLQTLGLWLALQATQEESGRENRTQLVRAAAVFALAFCVKQQNVTLAFMSCLPVLIAFRQGRIPLKTVAFAGVAGFVTVFGILGMENLLTSGRMWQTVFVYPSGPFRAINYAGWSHVLSVFDISARRTVGLLALAISCACLLPRPRFTKLDAFLGTCLLLELLTLAPLCLFNAGAASNYALQAVVLACVIVGRLVDQLVCFWDARREFKPGWRLTPLCLSLVFMAGSHGYWIRVSERVRNSEHKYVQELMANSQVSDLEPSSRYFVTLQHLNRLSGNPSLIHDDWLYGAFERATDAEPRNQWLQRAITEGNVRQVVTPGEEPRVPGLTTPLTDLGFTMIAQHGNLRVWQRH